MRISIIYSIALFGVIVGSYGWLQPGTSLCFINGRDVVSQIQFSPRYWHRNQIQHAGVSSVDLVPNPSRPGEQTLRISGGRMELIYGFVNSSWVNDIEKFQQEVAAVVEGQRRFACRLRHSLWMLAVGILIVLGAAGVLIVRQLQLIK